MLPYKGKLPEVRRTLSAFGHGLSSDKKSIIEIKNADVQRDLLVLEEQEVGRMFDTCFCACACACACGHGCDDGFFVLLR